MASWPVLTELPPGLEAAQDVSEHTEVNDSHSLDSPLNQEVVACASLPSPHGQS